MDKTPELPQWAEGHGMDRGMDRAERARILTSAKDRERTERWNAPARARVVHPTRGTVVVPHRSNLTALMNAAEVWGCRLTDLEDARVWAAEPGDVAEERPESY